MMVAEIWDEEAGGCVFVVIRWEGVNLHPRQSLSSAHGWFCYFLVKNRLKRF